MKKEPLGDAQNVVLRSDNVSRGKLADISAPVRDIIEKAMERKKGCDSVDLHQYYIESPAHDYYVDT